MTERRVVVTGVGAISCLGGGVPAFWAGLMAGGGNPEPIPDPLAHMKARQKYLVPAADIPAEPRQFAEVPLGRGPRTGVAAALDAVRDARLEAPDRTRMPVVMGVEMGNAEMHESGELSGDRWRPMTVGAAAVSAAVGSAAGSVSVGNACAASGYALTVAADMIRAGEADVVLAGGADGGSRAALGAFNRLGALDPVRCRPFDRHRKGTVFGDGAVFIVLEGADHAAGRDCPPYAELAGDAWSCDAFHITAPEPTGALIIETMRSALARSRMRADDIGAIIPHGTGTPLNDAVESRALNEVFGPRCATIPVLNLKGMIGHTGGAAGAFAVLAAVLMLRAGVVPAGLPTEEPDPECPVYVPQQGPVPITGNAAMANAYAFGGTNVSMILTRSEGYR
ncbi:MAG TPA: beta-ketoacyl synthase N-terminal-like domain-containing protein [Streptosporangiaceae bacterium]|jgi:3-oxoacyl-[acyl-carrier-protein] synthase II